MTEQQIRESLCRYDKRNPDFDIENGEKSTPCFCDNCFYSRDELARYLLETIREIKELREVIRYG